MSKSHRSEYRDIKAAAERHKEDTGRVIVDGTSEDKERLRRENHAFFNKQLRINKDK